jgi:hypothetical protein
MAGFTFGELARSGLAAIPRNGRPGATGTMYDASATGQPGFQTGLPPPSGGVRMPPIVTPTGPTKTTGGMAANRAATAGGAQYAGMPQPSYGSNAGGTYSVDPMTAIGSTAIAGYGGSYGNSPGVTAGTATGSGNYGSPIGSGMTQANATGSQGQANYGPNASVDWRKGWNGDLGAIQGAAGKVNIGRWNAMAQNDREAQHRAQVAAQRAGITHSADASGSGLTLEQRLAAANNPNQSQSQNDPAQMEVWQTSTDPTRLGGWPMQNWNPAQLQAGLQYYTQQQAGAVPGSNEWNLYQDYIDSINRNLSGNRSPVEFPSQGGAGYFGNNAGTPAAGWNLGGGPRS